MTVVFRKGAVAAALGMMLAAEPGFCLSPGKMIGLDDKGAKFTSVGFDFARTELNNNLTVKMDPKLIDWGMMVTDNISVRLGGGISEINMTDRFNGDIGFFYQTGVNWNFLTLDNDIQVSIAVDMRQGSSRGFNINTGITGTRSEWTQWQVSLMGHRTFFEKLSVYTGGTYSQADLKIIGMPDSGPEHTVGVFAGAELALTSRWSVNGEFRLGGEEGVSFGLITKY